MPEPTPLSPLLLRELDWVRGLATSLARDAHLAEDLTQEAWLAVHRTPPPEGSSIRRWLATVLKNLVRQERRGGARREDRESLAHGERVPESGAGDVLERAAVQKRVVETVMELDEPYRTTVLLRYFDDRQPVQIARDLGVSTATVKTRLMRARRLLRERLAREDGGGSWLTALLPLVAERPAAAGLSTGGLIVSSKVALVAGSVAGTLLIGGWWALGSETESLPAAESREVHAVEAASPELAPPLAAARSEVARTAAPEPEPGPDAAPTAFVALERDLFAIAVDAAGRPVPGLDLVLLSGTAEIARVVTDATGEALFPPLARGGRVVAASETYVTLLEGVVLGNAPRESVVVVVAESCELAGEIVDENGDPVVEAEVRLVIASRVKSDFGIPLDRSSFAEWVVESDPVGIFSIGRAPCLERAHLRVQRTGFEDATVELDGRPAVGLRVVLTTAQAGSEFLLGRVVDPRGRPVEGAWVAIGHVSTQTDRDGGFQLDLWFNGVPIEDTELRALAPGFLPARLARDTVLHPETGWPAFCLLALDGTPLALRGRVVDSDGLPVPDVDVRLVDRSVFGWLMEERSDVSYAHAGYVEELLAASEESGRTDAEGRFEIEGLLDRSYDLWAVGPALRAARMGPVQAGTEGVEIVLPGATRVALSGRVVRPNGDPVEGVTISPIRKLETPADDDGPGESLYAFARTQAITGPDGRFVFDALATEGVELQVWGGAGVGFVHRSLDDVENGDELEIVLAANLHFSVELTEAGVADSFRIEDAAGLTLVLRRSHGDVNFTSEAGHFEKGRSDVYSVSETARTLVLLSGEEQVLRLPVSLRAGEVTRIRP